DTDAARTNKDTPPPPSPRASNLFVAETVTLPSLTDNGSREARDEDVAPIRNHPAPERAVRHRLERRKRPLRRSIVASAKPRRRRRSPCHPPRQSSSPQNRFFKGDCGHVYEEVRRPRAVANHASSTLLETNPWTG